VRGITIILLFVFSFSSYSQPKDTVICEGLGQLNIWTTLTNHPFSRELLRFDVDSVSQGFEIKVSDEKYRIQGFRAYFLGDCGDIYYKDILGPIATRENFPVLKHGKGGLIEVMCVTVRQGNILYLAKPFSFLFY
jgi:hypothetical protein